jgi:hypothetical protein
VAFGHGKDTVFKLAGTDITAYLTKEDIKRMCATADTTTQGKSSKTFIAGLKDSSITLAGPLDPTSNTIFIAALGVSTSWEFAPQGTASGKVKITGTAFCTDYSTSSDVGSVVTVSVQLQGTGDITDTTY